MEQESQEYHVPQQSRRHKLRYIPTTLPYPNNPSNPNDLLLTSAATSALNLSLSSSTHPRSSSPYPALNPNPTPIGPFTGYASILARSTFLRPAQDLLEGFGGVVGPVGVTKNVLEESGRLFCDDDDHQLDTASCTNPNLLSMLHQVYKKYRLYCQQMQSAVTSFESVAGLANAAPFISFAVRAMFRHFHCLKNAILDQIRVTNKGFGGVVCRRESDSSSCPDDNGPYDPKHGQGQGQGPNPNFLQHPVWRSQRGFPDKAVAVLRTWLFEHFLHPYPSDSDKQMLAQKTGLSRSQVSNWFTNARVRLWKPMVEEIHSLERKAVCSKSTDTSSQFIALSSDSRSSPLHPHPHLTEKDFEIMNRHRDHENHAKRSRIEAISRAEQSNERFGLPCTHLMTGNQIVNFDSQQIGQLSHSHSLGGNEQNTGGLPWSAQGQIIPFWLARQ